MLRIPSRSAGATVALVWLLFLALACGSAMADRRVALVMGNAHYGKINRLENPLNDAPDLAEALRKLGFDVILRTDADKGGFDRALSEFARKAAGADAALFYYAGHGIQYQRQNYLLPIDIEVEDYNDVEFQAVNVARVMSALERSSGVKIIVLDACRDNPLDRRLTQASRAVSASRGLARIDRTEGLVIAYATAPDQVAQDGRGRNSPFTEALIRRLAEPGLEIATLFRRVTQDVYERTEGRQRPEVSISLLGDYFLNGGETDALAWARVRESSDGADFQAFKARYPNSPFAREAQYRLDMLDRFRKVEEQRVAFEQERARERERVQREAQEQDRIRLEAQRRIFARLEADAARDAERRAAERREEARLEAERQAAEKREAERQSAEKQDAAREAEKLAIQRRIEAERVAAARREAERVAAEDLARREAAQREADRREVERIAAQKRLDAERQRAADAEADRQEALRIAEQSKEALRREVEQLAARRRQDGDHVADLGSAPADPGLSRRLTEAERQAVEQRAFERRQALEADRRELARLSELRKHAPPREARRLDAAIRKLQSAIAARDKPATAQTP